MSSAIKELFIINILKTIYFNLHYLPLRDAIKLPILIYRRTKLCVMKGRIHFETPIKTGIVKLGPQNIGTQDKRYSRTIWEVRGDVHIKGKTKIGRGCKICVGNEGNLIFGSGFSCTGDTQIVCFKEISFGNNCLLSWNILMMDTDFHDIRNREGEKINNNKPISIGNHVWIGCRSNILKGVSIGNNNIISASSTITRSIEEHNCIIGGNGKHLDILKRDIEWG